VNRVNVYDDTGALAGWFDQSSAIPYAPKKLRRAEVLWHTRGGRWVHEAEVGRSGSLGYRYLIPAQAAVWLLDQGYTKELVHEVIGPPQLGTPGRPEVGPAVQVRLDPEVLARLDGLAAVKSTTRAALIRKAVDHLLWLEEEEEEEGSDAEHQGE
jgi:hypothetical protein